MRIILNPKGPIVRRHPFSIVYYINKFFNLNLIIGYISAIILPYSAFNRLFIAVAARLYSLLLIISNLRILRVSPRVSRYLLLFYSF